MSEKIKYSLQITAKFSSPPLGEDLGGVARKKNSLQITAKCFSSPLTKEISYDFGRGFRRGQASPDNAENLSIAETGLRPVSTKK